LWGSASGSGGAAGVLLGGVLSPYLSWPWIFFINVPVGVAVLASTPFLLNETRGSAYGRRHFDLAGAASVTSGIMLLVYGLTRGTDDGWTSRTTIGFLAAAALLLDRVLVLHV